MPIAPQERNQLLLERRLLRNLVALAHRCEGAPPRPLLDAVLSGAEPVRLFVPQQRRG
jgi:hypothetical protein